MVPLCRHIKINNRPCGSPALKGQLLCFSHQQVKKITRRPVRPGGFSSTIPFVFCEDRAAIQVNLQLVLQHLADGKIDTRTANAMTNTLRAARINLGKTPLLEEDREATVQRVILTPEGEEIAPPREALEEGENPPLHHQACPCQKCAEEFRDQPAEQHHQNCQCGLCEEGMCRETDGPALKTATAQKLYNKELTRDPANKEVNLYDYLYGEHHKKYEAQYAARAKAAIEAGIEPPPYEPFAINKIELECEKRYKATMEQVEKNKQIGKEIRERLFGKDEPETNPESINNEFNPATDMKEQARIAFANQPPEINPDLW